MHRASRRSARSKQRTKIIHPVVGLKQSREAGTRSVLHIFHTRTGVSSKVGPQRMRMKGRDCVARRRTRNDGRRTAWIEKRTREEFSRRIIGVCRISLPSIRGYVLVKGLIATRVVDFAHVVFNMHPLPLVSSRIDETDARDCNDNSICLRNADRRQFDLICGSI